MQSGSHISLSIADASEPRGPIEIRVSGTSPIVSEAARAGVVGPPADGAPLFVPLVTGQRLAGTSGSSNTELNNDHPSRLAVRWVHVAARVDRA